MNLNTGEILGILFLVSFGILGIMPGLFDKKIYKKYGNYVLKNGNTYVVGILMYLYIFSLLLNFGIIISTPIIIYITCREISSCWTRCIDIGLNKTELKVALFYQCIYPLMETLALLGLILEIEKMRGNVRRK